MRKNDKLIIVGVAAAVVGFVAMKRKAAGQAMLPQLRELWGGGMPSTPPQTIVDYYGGRSVAEVLANPGPLFQHQVLDYRAGHPSALLR